MSASDDYKFMRLFNRFDGRRKGDEYYMLCPYHSERKPSLSVNLDSGRWHCMGCGEGGGAADLLAELAGMSKTEARSMIRERLGRVSSVSAPVTLPEKKFSGAFLPVDDCVGAIQYLRGRGISRKGQRMLDLRVGAPNDPIWKRRIVYAIRNGRGRIASIEGRLFSESEITPRRPYHKEGRASRGLLGIESVGRGDRVLVVEGWADLLSVRQIGFVRSVAMCGSDLGLERARMLRSVAGKAVVLYDGAGDDPASRDRAEEAARKGLGRCFRADDFDVLRLENGRDPNELLAAGELKRAMSEIGLRPRLFC